MNQEHLGEEVLAVMMFAIDMFENVRQAKEKVESRIKSKWRKQDSKSHAQIRKDATWRRTEKA